MDMKIKIKYILAGLCLVIFPCFIVYLIFLSEANNIFVQIPSDYVLFETGERPENITLLNLNYFREFEVRLMFAIFSTSFVFSLLAFFLLLPEKNIGEDREEKIPELICEGYNLKRLINVFFIGVVIPLAIGSIFFLDRGRVFTRIPHEYLIINGEKLIDNIDISVKLSHFNVFKIKFILKYLVILSIPYLIYFRVGATRAVERGQSLQKK